MKQCLNTTVSVLISHVLMCESFCLRCLLCSMDYARLNLCFAFTLYSNLTALLAYSVCTNIKICLVRFNLYSILWFILILFKFEIIMKFTLRNCFALFCSTFIVFYSVVFKESFFAVSLSLARLKYLMLKLISYSYIV